MSIFGLNFYILFMKAIKFIFFFLLSVNAFSQQIPFWLTDKSVDTNFDKRVYLYSTIEDYKSDKGEYIGEYVVNTWDNVMGHNSLFYKKDGKEEKVNLNKYFGFKIGTFYFVMNAKKPKTLMKVIKEKEKVFYVEGGFYTNMIFNKRNKGTSTRTRYPLYYSDSLGSEFIEFKEIFKLEANNQNLKDLLNCFNNAKKLDSHVKVQVYFDCITNF